MAPSLPPQVSHTFNYPTTSASMRASSRKKRSPVKKSSEKSKSLSRTPRTSSKARINDSSTRKSQIDAAEHNLNCSFLRLPLEIRLLVYGYLSGLEGSIRAASQHFERPRMRADLMRLMHTCKMTREDMSVFFLRCTTFEFISVASMDNFEDKIDQDASNIRKVKFSGLLVGQKAFEAAMVRFVSKFSGVEYLHLAILKRNDRYLSVTELPDQDRTMVTTEAGTQLWALHRAVLGERALAIIKASSQIASGRILFETSNSKRAERHLYFAPSNTVFKARYGSLIPDCWGRVEGEISMRKTLKSIATRKEEDATVQNQEQTLS